MQRPHFGVLWVSCTLELSAGFSIEGAQIWAIGLWKYSLADSMRLCGVRTSKTSRSSRFEHVSSGITRTFAAVGGGTWSKP